MYLRKITKGYLYTPNVSLRYTRNMCIVPPKYHQDMSRIFIKYLRARSKPLAIRWIGITWWNSQ